MKHQEDEDDEKQGSESPNRTTWKDISYDEIELGERIGGGGVGIVYEGWLGRRRVALKTLFDPHVDESLKKEFMDELLVMSQLKHPNIISIIGACSKAPNLFFVMELCEQSVYNLLHGEEPRDLSTREQLNIMLDVAKAMDYLHTRRPAIIHRDLKTHNLLISPEGVTKLCDFGLVRTRNTMAGTPNYMAPELLDNRPFNKSVDVYAFGIVFYEVMTCRVFLDGYDAADIRRKVLAGERPKPPTVDCPETCQRLMQRCWSADPKDRPDFEEVIEVIEEAIDNLPTGRSNLQDLEGCGEEDALDSLMSCTSPKRK